MISFNEQLVQAQQRSGSWLCIGLDPLLERLPAAARREPEPLIFFCRAIVEATADLVCAFKPNLAFWLAEGLPGLAALEAVRAAIPAQIPVILDAKFGDVGHTAAAYARFAFDQLHADGVTLNPYLGLDNARPFLERAGKGAFVLARTSNPSAPDLQDRPVDGAPLYQVAARLAAQWDASLPGNCGLVVGATYPEEMAHLRTLAPQLPFLIPGIGAQGGSLKAAVAHGPTAYGVGPLVNASRNVLYASSGADFADAARAAACELRDRISVTREQGEEKTK